MIPTIMAKAMEHGMSPLQSITFAQEIVDTVQKVAQPLQYQQVAQPPQYLQVAQPPQYQVAQPPQYQQLAQPHQFQNQRQPTSFGEPPSRPQPPGAYVSDSRSPPAGGGGGGGGRREGGPGQSWGHVLPRVLPPEAPPRYTHVGEPHERSGYMERVQESGGEGAYMQTRGAQGYTEGAAGGYVTGYTVGSGDAGYKRARDEDDGWNVGGQPSYQPSYKPTYDTANPAYQLRRAPHAR
jgi:hypothetical protein